MLSWRAAIDKLSRLILEGQFRTLAALVGFLGFTAPVYDHLYREIAPKRL